VGSGAPHRFPQVRKHRKSLGALEDHTRSEKTPSLLRFAGAPQKSVTKKMSPNRFRRQLANDVPQNPANDSKEIIVLKSAR